MGALPVDFEAKVKDPKAIGAGYPYSIKAEDLMKNFVDAKLEVDGTTHSSGLMLEEYTAWGDNGHKGRAIRISESSSFSGGALHPFKVTRNAQAESKVDIAIGTVYHETGAFIVSAQTAMTPQDEILLKITRDVTSREVINAEVSGYSVSFDPVSTNHYQYIHIASVSSSEIIQRKFEDISIFEDLAIVNGQFKLVPLEVVGFNFYDLP